MSAIAEPVEFLDDEYICMVLREIPQIDAPDHEDACFDPAAGARVLHWTVERICACAATA